MKTLAELRDDRSEPLQQIARMCVRWADDYAGIVADCDPDMEMINRNRDNWRPLFAIADVFGEDWPDRIREAAATLAPREADRLEIFWPTSRRCSTDVQANGPTGCFRKCWPMNWPPSRAAVGRVWQGAEADHQKPTGPTAEGFQDHAGHCPDRHEVTQGLLPAPVRGGLDTLSCPHRGFRNVTTSTSLLPQALLPRFET